MKALLDSVAFLTTIEVLDLVVITCWCAFDVYCYVHEKRRGR